MSSPPQKLDLSATIRKRLREAKAVRAFAMFGLRSVWACIPVCDLPDDLLELRTYLEPPRHENPHQHIVEVTEWNGYVEVLSDINEQYIKSIACIVATESVPEESLNPSLEQLQRWLAVQIENHGETHWKDWTSIDATVRTLQELIETH